MVNPRAVCADLWLMVCIVYVAYAMPLRLGFDVPVDGPGSAPGISGWFWVDAIVDLSFLVDFFMNFLTGHFDYTGTLVYNKSQIALNYTGGLFMGSRSRGTWIPNDKKIYSWIPLGWVFGWCFWDFVSSLPITYVMLMFGYETDESNMDDTKVVRVVRLVRLAKLLRLGRFKRMLDSGKHRFFLPVGAANVDCKGTLRIELFDAIAGPDVRVGTCTIEMTCASEASEDGTIQVTAKISGKTVTDGGDLTSCDLDTGGSLMLRVCYGPRPLHRSQLSLVDKLSDAERDNRTLGEGDW